MDETIGIVGLDRACGQQGGDQPTGDQVVDHQVQAAKHHALAVERSLERHCGLRISRPAAQRTAIEARTDEHRTEDYRRVHPLGLIPALRPPDGRAVFESAGIVMYLADRFPDAGLAPPADRDDRALFNQWLFFLSDTLYPTYNRLYHSERFSVAPEDAGRIEERCRQLLIDQWRVVENALGAREWLVGDRCTAADIYLQMVSTWDQDPESFGLRCPNVIGVAAAVAQRPAVSRAVSRHQAA